MAKVLYEGTMVTNRRVSRQLLHEKHADTTFTFYVYIHTYTYTYMFLYNEFIEV